MLPWPANCTSGRPAFAVIIYMPTFFTSLVVAWVLSWVVAWNWPLALLAADAPGESAAQSRATARLTIAELMAQLDHLGAHMTSTDRHECGLRALAVLSQMRGIACGLSDLRRESPVGRRGSSMLDLEIAATRRGFCAESVHCSPNDLDHLPLPAIAQQEPGGPDRIAHFVVVLQVRPRSVMICDPTVGTISELLRDDYCRFATGNYLVVLPGWMTRSWAVAWYIGGAALFVAAGLLLKRRRARGNVPAVSRWLRWAFFTFALLAPAAPLIGCGGHELGQDGGAGRLRATFPNSNSGFGAKMFVADVGVFDEPRKVMHTFAFMNSSDETITLRLDSRSCGCVTVALRPEILDPNAEAEVSITLDLAEKHAGMINENVVVAIVGTADEYQFACDALLEGVSPLSGQYVVRQSDLDRARVPPIGLVLFTAEREDSFQVDSVEATDPRIKARVDLLEVGDPKPRTARCFARSVTVPVEMSGEGGPSEGKVVVQYTLHGKHRSLSIPALVLLRK